MDETDPKYMNLLFDTGHFYYCGVDPAKMCRKYINRIRHVHLKDVRTGVVAEVKEKDMSFLDGVRAGTFTVPGDGDYDFTDVFRILDEGGYEGWLLVEAEQDPARANPLEYAIKARKYIARQTGL